VPPEEIRYLRLDQARCTTIATIDLPQSDEDAAKYVREAVLAYPELYFSRLVVLGEGDSEEVVLPRMFAAHEVMTDHISVSVVPLGGRHVNHFWRLLSGLGIPHITLLDLDAGRYQGGWGRIRYAFLQLEANSYDRERLADDDMADLPTWDSADRPDRVEAGVAAIERLEEVGVFFSTPLDLDYAMLRAYPSAYGVSQSGDSTLDDRTVISVLGKSHGPEQQYSGDELANFDAYREKFKRGSKPATHLEALANLSDGDLVPGLPAVYKRMIAKIIGELDGVPE
jgi:putative ATP-dependent endonuclease of OLD family